MDIFANFFGEVLPTVRLIGFGVHEGISMSFGAFRNATWEFDLSQVF